MTERSNVPCQVDWDAVARTLTEAVTNAARLGADDFVLAPPSLDELAALADTITPPRTHSMEVGPSVLAWLREHAHDPGLGPGGASPLGALTGIPIIERADLAPGAWRIRDANGDIISEGNTTEPNDG
jgi:hypothetical protein